MELQAMRRRQLLSGWGIGCVGVSGGEVLRRDEPDGGVGVHTLSGGACLRCRQHHAIAMSSRQPRADEWLRLVRPVRGWLLPAEHRTGHVRQVRSG
jgi:hypothetical protein